MGAQFGIVMGPQRGAIHGKQLQSLENVSTAILRAPVPGRVIEQPFQRFGSHALARLRRCALAHKRSLRVGQRQAEIVQHFADRFMPVQRQGNHQPHHLLSRQAPMTDTGCVSAFDRLFNPLNRQMLAQPAPVWRFEVVGEEMDGVVEHGRRRLTAVQTVYNRPMKKCRSVLTERHYRSTESLHENAVTSNSASSSLEIASCFKVGSTTSSPSICSIDSANFKSSPKKPRRVSKATLTSSITGIWSRISAIGMPNRASIRDMMPTVKATSATFRWAGRRRLASSSSSLPRVVASISKGEAL